MSPALCEIDDYDLETFTKIAANFGTDRCDFVVTPNADHLIRLEENESFRTLYAQAGFILLDSRFIAKLIRLTRGVSLPVCAGSDLTAELLTKVIAADDALILIGASDPQASTLESRYGLRKLAHHNPPMGFIKDADAVEACLDFIEHRSPFRFCFLAIGSPQQEIIAQKLKERGRARGLVLCVGGSINFLTGEERRAPKWLQNLGLEWTFRLLQAPKRMGHRYLVRGPKLFSLLRRQRIVLRPVALAQSR